MSDNNLTFRGVVTRVLEPIQKENAKGAFAVRTFSVREEGDDKYPNEGVFELFKNGEYIDYALDKFPAKVGDLVEVTYNLSAREWGDKVFGSNRVFMVKVIESAPNKTHDGLETMPTPQQSDEDKEDDLPF